MGSIMPITLKQETYWEELNKNTHYIINLTEMWGFFMLFFWLIKIL
jgi:hypothetical protein